MSEKNNAAVCSAAAGSSDVQADLRRQCALMLEMAEQNISEFEELASDDEESARADDLRADLQSCWNLIAAAPELYAALARIEQLADHEGPADAEYLAAWAAVRAALALARTA